MYPQFFSKVRSLVLLTGLILVFTTACTRKSQEDGTKVRMNFSSTFSKAQSLAGIAIPTGYYPGHLVANVQFDGQTALYHWDCKEMENDGDPALCAFPDFIDFNGRTFPNGSNRIVQVLIVFSNENDQLLFAYDDEIGVAFSGGDVYVDIGDNWSLEGGGKMARVSGRHGLAKSGKVEGFYQPKRTGRPRMKLFDEYIFNGWFSLMFFEGVKLSYYHTGVAVGGTETALFVEKSLESLEAEMTSTKAAIQINIPSFYKVFEENPPNYRSDRDGGENVVIGFFDSTGKPQANGTTFSLAKPTAAVSVSYVFRNILNGTLLDPIGNDGQFVNPSTGNSGGLLSEWSPSHELNFVMGTDPNLPNSFIQSHGIGATNATACAGVSDSDLVTPKCIMIRPEFVREHKVVPFEGPFEAIVGTHGPETIANTSQTSVEWRFLPGVAGVAVHGLAFFIVNSSDEFHDRAPCHEMALKAGISGTANLPFVDANVPPIYGHRLVNVSATSTSGSLDFGATTNLNGKKALACPWINVSGVKYFSTFAVDNHGFFNSGGTTNIAAGNFNYGFSGDGIFVENNTAGGNSDDVANGIAVDSSGNKIVVGYSYNGGPNTDAVIWKLLPNGTLDSSFGTAGRVVLDQLATTLYSGASDYATDVAIDSNGKIVVVGYSYNNTPNLDMFALRLNNDGSLDTSFNGTGKWAFDNAGGDDKAYGVKVNASNQIYITGVSYYGANGDDMVVVKLNNDGSNDAGFNGGSPFNHHNLLGGINEGGNDLVILPNSDILVAGYAYNGSYNKAVVWKVVGDGSGLSGSFAGSGAYSYACAMDCVAEALTVDDSGDIFINGYSMGAFSNMMVLKLKADGSSLDSTFASAGVYIDTSISAGNGASFGYDIALDGAQNIVVAGRSYEDVSSEFRLAVWRLTPGGNLEGSFAMGTGVFHSSTLAGGPVANDSGNALVIENDGRIFVAGQAENGTPNFDMVVVAIE